MSEADINRLLAAIRMVASRSSSSSSRSSGIGGGPSIVDEMLEADAQHMVDSLASIWV